MPTDPICGMHVPQSSDITLEQDGQKYFFCSTGCKIKFQAPEEENKKERTTLMVAWAFSLPVLLINYLLAVPSKDYIMLALALPVQFYSGLLFYRGAYQALRMRSGNMDLLISIGTLTAFFFSAFVTLFPGYFSASGVYFDTSTFIISLILTGNYIQGVMELRANDAANKLLSRIPSHIHIIDDKGEIKDIEIDAVEKGDVILIKPGENVPVDGNVLEGKTEVDESMLTGEAEPVLKIKGSKVISGTVNINGAIKVEVEGAGKDSTLSKLYTLIKQAATGKLKIQRLADTFSSYFVPIVIIAAIVAASIWYVSLSSADSGLVAKITVLAFVSVIVIACPCAIGLATPITLLVSSNISSSRFILMKNMSAMDRLSKVNIVVFDKTGTLTEAKPDVNEVLPASKVYNANFILSYAASIEQYSNHPIAKAITEFAKGKHISLLDVTGEEEKPGVGVSGVIKGERVEVRGGSDKNRVSIFVNGRRLGDVTLSYRIKESSKAVIRKFEESGIKTAMVTGDKLEEARRVGNILGITDIHAEITPEKKADIIKAYQQNGLYVMYAGDGINDAAAIETADFGVALGGGSDIAKESGDAVLLKDDMMLLYDIYVIGRATISKVKQNIGWAIGYNAALMPIAGGAVVPLFGLGIYSFLPILAAAAMGMSSVSVVLNSLLLKRTINKRLGRE
ncbi:cadmium-translocating P-type ATPase [Candidatus Parvarchaeota archaeon]|uniref:Cadmium-translocating P-type ATPase n=1 Tax=Candidatus Acidifodinimicrobium mancum TaxID=2898728 RepID=A0A8T3UTA0_9ARCH|nr:cadmium-translocating P-type ATPase [Candidatus Acidifodinimicrobium mancum]